MTTTILKGKKFTVEITSGRPDPIRITVIQPSGKKASHHLRDDETDVLIFALRKAKKAAKRAAK